MLLFIVVRVHVFVCAFKQFWVLDRIGFLNDGACVSVIGFKISGSFSLWFAWR